MDDVISGALVFTGERSRQGYRLNKMAMSLTSAENCARFQADEAGYMRGLGLSEAETAAALGIPAGTAKSRLHRGLRNLRRQLERYAADRGFARAPSDRPVAEDMPAGQEV